MVTWRQFGESVSPEGITFAEKPDELELIDADLLQSNLGSIRNNIVENNLTESSASLPMEADIMAMADEMYARDLQSQLNSLPSQEMKTSEVEITSVCDVLKILQERVNESKQFFLKTRRQVPLSWILKLWQRQERKSTVTNTLVAKYVGEDGIDEGALGK